MQLIFNILILGVLATVLVILTMGLWNMFRGDNPNRSQKLMRARVIAQAIAVLLLLTAFFLFAPRG